MKKANGKKQRPAMPARPSSRKIVAALDIGSVKIACFIAEVYDSGELNVIGIGHNASHGVKSGTIADLRAVEEAIGHAVQSAEKMALPRLMGQPIQSVTVNVPALHTSAHRMSVDIRVSGHEITERDLRRIMAQAHEIEVPEKETLIHTIPAHYSLDGHHGIRDPRGMFGDVLSVQLSAIAAHSNALRNIASAVGQNHLEISGYCSGPFAAGLACLVEDERELGCTVVDMGGGTTSIAVFMEGKPVYTAAIPVGGAHVTSDIARGLTTSLSAAERLKTLHGSAITSGSDDAALIDVPQVGEEEQVLLNQVPRSLLVGIIRPRIEETFELVRAKLEDNGLNQAAGRRVVLTGGASALSGMTEMAQMILDKKVRLGKPQKTAGLAEATSGPAFSTAAGLLRYAAEAAEQPREEEIILTIPGNLLEKVAYWIRQNW